MPRSFLVIPPQYSYGFKPLILCTIIMCQVISPIFLIVIIYAFFTVALILVQRHPCVFCFFLKFITTLSHGQEIFCLSLIYLSFI